MPRMVQPLILALFFLNSALYGQDAVPAKTLVRFLAMGDLPYAKGEYDLLVKQIERLPVEGNSFAVHVGDIKPGAWQCDESIYLKVSNILKQSKLPVFALVGDNEWNDCTDPDAAWKLWTKYFMRFEQNWAHQLGVYHSLEREENLSFVRNGVLFIGLNLVGGQVFEDEWNTRLAQDVKWVERNLDRFGEQVSSLVLMGHAQINQKHDGFIKPFNVIADKFGKPVLYLQGDGHRWIHDRPFPAQNILRVQVDQGGIAPPLLVSVTDDKENPFQFERRLEEPEQLLITIDANEQIRVGDQTVTVEKLAQSIPERSDGLMVVVQYAESIPNELVKQVYGTLKEHHGVMVRRELIQSK